MYFLRIYSNRKRHFVTSDHPSVRVTATKIHYSPLFPYFMYIKWSKTSVLVHKTTETCWILLLWALGRAWTL